MWDKKGQMHPMGCCHMLLAWSGRLTNLFVLLLEWVWSGGVDSEEQIQRQQMEHGYKVT